MQHFEVRGAVRPLQSSLGVKGLKGAGGLKKELRLPYVEKSLHTYVISGVMFGFFVCVCV